MPRSTLGLLEALNIENRHEIVTKIIGGDDVPVGAYPWFTRLSWSGCGGTLISKEFVLTAAHCMDNTKYGVFQVGALCRDDDENCAQKMEEFSARLIYVHPSYTPELLQHDVALIRLNGESSITPAKIDLEGLADSFESGRSLWPIGFGVLEYGTKFQPNHLQHVEVHYVSNDVCTESFVGSDYEGIFQAESMMCAASAGKDACFKDSGGPLYDYNNDIVVGVVSWGIGCALPDYPGVYARISSSSSWIKDVVCKYSKNGEQPSWCFAPEPSNSPSLEKITNSPSEKKTANSPIENEPNKKLPCRYDEHHIVINFQLRNENDGIRWSVKRRVRPKVFSKVVSKGKREGLNSREKTVCVPKGECYRLTIRDIKKLDLSYSFDVFQDGTEIIQKDIRIQNRAGARFGDC